MGATKEQERKALAQIKKIVESLGEDSYIGMAFEGCFEIAEENIENDWGCSMKQRYETAEKQRRQDELEIIDLREARDAAIKRAEKAEKLFNDKVGTADRHYAAYCEARDNATENWNKFREQEDRADALEQEIIKLKAKLYDLMTAQ